jgi:hypothetical protein
MKLTNQIFSPPFSEFFVLEIVKDFLNDKKTKYKQGLISVKSYYD